jgi:uncharacterized membrane protein
MHSTSSHSHHLPAGEDPPLAGVLRRNIEALVEVRRQQERRKTLEERVADGITGFAGSMRFVYVHALLFGGWIVVNLHWLPGVRPFDPSFVILAMVASVEAIFLSTFILISQNRMAAVDERRADLDLQISLLAEHEITRLIELVDGLSRRLGAAERGPEDVEELKQDVHPEQVLHVMEAAEERSARREAA